jgi:hypothetical protein
MWQPLLMGDNQNSRRLIELEYALFQHNGQNRLQRDATKDEAVIREKLSEFLLGNTSDLPTHQGCEENARDTNPLELFYDVANIADRPREEWYNRLVFGVSDLRERYRTKRLCIHTHIKIGQRETGQFCAIFEAHLLHD